MKHLPKRSTDAHESGICANQLWTLGFGFRDLHPLDQAETQGVPTIFENP